MSLPDLFKPKWKNSNWEIREKAIAKIDDQNILAQIAKNDAVKSIRIKAVSKITDQELLADLVEDAACEEVRKTAVFKISNRRINKYIIENNPDSNVRMVAIEKIKDQEFLSKLAQYDPNKNIRLLSLQKITRQDILQYLIENASCENVRITAVNKIVDKNILMKIVENSLNEKVINAALVKISNPKILADIVKNSSKKNIQLTTLKLIKDESVLVNLMNFITDQKILSYIIKNVSCDGTRLNGVKKITDKSILEEIAKNDPSISIRKYAMNRLSNFDQEMLADIARSDSNKYNRIAAVEEISDKSILTDLANYASCYNVRLAAASKLDAQGLMASWIKYNPDKEFRILVIEKITDPKILVDLLKSSSFEEIRFEAIKKINDQNVIKIVAQKDSSKKVRLAAVEKITENKVLEYIIKNDIIEDVREAAKRQLSIQNKLFIDDISDQNILFDIANTESDWQIRTKAVNKISDQDLLIIIAKNNAHREVQLGAINKISDINALIDISTALVFGPVRTKIFDKLAKSLDKINDQNILGDIALSASDWEIRVKTIEKISDKYFLEELSKTTFKYNFNITAIDRKIEKKDFENLAQNISYGITHRIIMDKLSSNIETLNNQNILCGMAKNATDYQIRCKAVNKILDKNIIIDIALNDSNEDVRSEAIRRLHDQEIITQKDQNTQNELKYKISRKSAFKRTITKMESEAFENIISIIKEKAYLNTERVNEIWNVFNNSNSIISRKLILLLILGKNFLYISVPEKIEEKIRNSFIVLMDINRKWHNSNEQKSYQYYKHHHLYRIFKNIQFKSSHDSLSGIDPTDMTSTERSIMYKTIGGDSIIDVYIDGKCYQLARYKKNIEYYQRHTGKQIILGTYVGGHLTTSKNDLSNWIIDYKIEKRLKQLDNLVLEDSIDPVLLKYFNKKNNSKYDQFLSEAKKNLLNSSINEHFEIFKKSTGLEKPNYIKNLFGELIIIEHLLEKLTETDNPNKINIYLIHLLKFNAKIHINTFLKKLSDIDRKNLILNQIHLIEQKILNSKNNFSLCENKNRQGGARNGK